jgi:hypothetical protein
MVFYAYTAMAPNGLHGRRVTMLTPKRRINIYDAITVSGFTVPDDAVFFYDFVNFFTSPTITDRSGNGRYGTPANVTQDDDEGSIFNDSNSGITVYDSNTAFNVSTRTIEVYVKIDSNADWGDTIISKPGNGSDFDLLVWDVWGGVCTVCFALGGGSRLASISSVALGTWHHIVCVQDGNRMHIYLDGEGDANTTLDYTPNYNNNPIGIGWDTYRLTKFFFGSIKFAGAYTTAWSASTVADRYNNLSSVITEGAKWRRVNDARVKMDVWNSAQDRHRNNSWK